MKRSQTYQISQRAIADLKSSIYALLELQNGMGMKNSEIGRALGIYTGHEGHEGHISRTLLAIMEEEGVVKQNDDKSWVLLN